MLEDFSLKTIIFSSRDLCNNKYNKRNEKIYHKYIDPMPSKKENKSQEFMHDWT
jgi:hypothetical protein